MVGTAPAHFIRTSRQNIYRVKSVARCNSHLQAYNLDPMKNHFIFMGSKELENIKKQQESFARDMWSAFQSLGYRLDCHDQVFEQLNERLWKLEHQEGRIHEDEK